MEWVASSIGFGARLRHRFGFAPSRGPSCSSWGLGAFEGVLPPPLWKWTLFLGAVLCGLLPYGIFLEAEGAWAWGGSMDVSALTDHLLRRDYGTFTLGHADSTSGLWAHPKNYLKGVPLEFLDRWR